MVKLSGKRELQGENRKHFTHKNKKIKKIEKSDELKRLNLITRSGEAYDGARSGLGGNHYQLEEGNRNGEEMAEGPLESIEAVIALVYPHHHRRCVR
jgi:hypothetical protein